MLFSKARGLNIRRVRTHNDVLMYINQHLIHKLSHSFVKIHNIRKDDDGNYVICGYLTTLFDMSDVKIKVSLFKYGSYNDVNFLNKENKHKLSYINSFEISAKNFECMSFKLLHIDTNVEVKVNIEFGKYSGLDKSIKHSYFAIEDDIIAHDNNSIYKSEKSILSMVKREVKLLIGLRRKRNVIAYRMLYWLSKGFFNKKNISLFIDRINNAGDNAEALFNYAQSSNVSKDCYYVISKKSDDYERLASQGNVIEYGSIRHRLYFLHAKNVISSHASDWAKNPFMKAEKYYRDLRTFDFVFLQHGVTYNDVSKSINKYNVGINKFICCSEYELESLKSEKYAYSDNELELTGFPRFDLLNNSGVEKIILLAPTWRRGLTENIDVRTGIKNYSTAFKHSEYFRRYNDLINDPRLINVLARTGYKILFMPHNEIRRQISDFDTNPHVIVADENQKYSEVFNISSLLITDYSSIFFDFSFLRKPVMFYQFDKEAFYRGHYESGYFDLNKFSFGKVISDHDLLVDSICSLIENGDFQKDEGIIDSSDFYKFNDNSNSERVFNLIFKDGLS
ncbi:CDP-glycerol glycerophosphotransferase family protein [Vibrio chagasii]